MMEPTREVHLSEDLGRAAETRFCAGFHSIDELLTFVLKELTRDDVDRLDEKEQRMIEERLRVLGYI